MRDEESMWIIVVDVTAVHAVFPGVFLRLTLCQNGFQQRVCLVIFNFIYHGRLS